MLIAKVTDSHNMVHMKFFRINMIFNFQLVIINSKMCSYCKLNLNFTKKVWKFSFNAWRYMHRNTNNTRIHLHLHTEEWAERRVGRGGEWEIEREREQLRKAKENHVSSSKFMQICIHVCQEKFPTTKLFSEVRDWKTSSPLFTWKYISGRQEHVDS